MTASNRGLAATLSTRVKDSITTTPGTQSSLSPSKPIVLAFDLYGTILSTSSISHALSKHFPQSQAETIATQWRKEQLEYTWRLNSMGMYQPFSTVTRNSLLAILRSQSSGPQALGDDAIEEVMGAYDTLSPFPDVPPALESLAQEESISAYIFTNGTHTMVSSSLQSSTLPASLSKIFKSIITIEEVRKYKPAPEVYWHLLAQVGKKREEAGEVWLVSGNEFDVVGAKALGLRAVWVDREGRGWGDGCLDLEPDCVVGELGEVVEKVKQFR